jgi:hypothetical protein
MQTPGAEVLKALKEMKSWVMQGLAYSIRQKKRAFF